MYNPNNRSSSSLFKQNALNVVGTEHYNPNKELQKEFDYERRDIKFAHESNLIEKMRKGEQMKEGLAGSSDLMSDLEKRKKAREEQSMVSNLKREYIRELDNYKADLFKKDNIYVSPDVGVSLIDNPFLVEGINSDQLGNLEGPSKVEERMEQLKEKEEALSKVISKLPIDDELYENMMAELELVAKDRADAEKEFLEFKLREDPDFAMPEGAYDKRRERIRRKLLKALDFGEKGETIKYDRFEGFYLWLDHIINVHRNFSQTYLTFKVIDATGETHELMQTMNKPLSKDVARFKRSFAERHRIYGVVPHNHTYIMFKFYVEEEFIKFDEEEFKDLLKVEEKDPDFKYEKKMVIYGWCPLKIFHNEKLRVGRWKIPLYKTPIPMNMDPKDLKAYSYLKYGELYVRIGLPQTSNETEILPADMAIRGYQQPGYLQEHQMEPELDEYFESENAKKDRRKRTKELALHRKKILIKLMEREKNIKEEIKRLNEEKRQNELDKEKQKILDDLEKELIRLEEEKKILDNEYKQLEDDIARAKNRKKERMDEKKKVKEMKNRYGLRVELQKLSGFSSFKTVRVVYGLYVENEPIYDDLGDEIQDSSQPYPSPKKFKKGKNTKAPKRVVRFQGEESLFVKNARGLVLLNKGSRKVYLGFKVLFISKERKKKKKKIKQDDEIEDPLADLPLPKPEKIKLVGWQFWNIASGSGKIKSSSKKVTINFYDPPLLKLPFEKTVLKETKMKLEFKMEEFFYEMASLPFFAELRMKKRKKLDKLRKIKPQKLKLTYKEPFIPNEETQWENRSFDKGSGIDIYVDALRFLPDNVTTTKIIVRIVDTHLNDLIFPQAGLPVLESDMLNPEYNFRQELRAPSYDPTLMIYITYLTVDARGDEKTPKIMGYSFFNLFINKYEDRQPISRSEQAFTVLHSGSYQIPIYCQQFKEEFPFYVKDANRYDKLPGSSALIRVRLAPRSANGAKVIGLKSKEVERIRDGPERIEFLEKYGIWVKAVEYKYGTYNNKLCGVGQTETELIQSRTLRKAQPCIESAKGLMDLFGTPLDESEGTKKDQEDKVIDFLDKFLTLRTDSEFLNLKYFSKYTGLQGGQKGFKLSIDGIHNIPDKGYYFCIYSVNPPGEFYGDKPDEASIRANSNFDWDSSTYSTIFYNENYSKYADVPYSPFTHFVIDVRSIKMFNNKPPEFKKVAWTVIPIFTNDGYVNSNIYQIPLFVGSPDPDMLKEMVNTDPWEYMMKNAKLQGNAGLTYWGKASIFCRLLDLQREGHFQNRFDFLRCVYEYLPETNRQDFIFNFDSVKKMRKQKLLQKLDPYGEDVVTFNKRLSDFVIEQYNIGNLDDSSEDSFDDDDYWYGEKKKVYDDDDYFEA